MASASSSRTLSWITNTDGVRVCAGCGSHGEEKVSKETKRNMKTGLDEPNPNAGRKYMACGDYNCQQPGKFWWFWVDQATPFNTGPEAPLKRKAFEVESAELAADNLKVSHPATANDFADVQEMKRLKNHDAASIDKLINVVSTLILMQDGNAQKFRTLMDGHDDFLALKADVARLKAFVEQLALDIESSK